MNYKKPRLWNPKARKCSQCSDLKPIKDKGSQAVDPGKSFCQRFGWEITTELAKTQAVCKIETTRRKRRPQTAKRGGKKH
jgi:hypothetical protein